MIGIKINKFIFKVTSKTNHDDILSFGCSIISIGAISFSKNQSEINAVELSATDGLNSNALENTATSSYKDHSKSFSQQYGEFLLDDYQEDYEVLHNKLRFFTGLGDSSLSFETFLEQMNREQRNNYLQAILDHDHIKQAESRMLFSWATSKYRSLKDKFESTDWRPLIFNYGVKPHKVGLSRDKNGKYHPEFATFF